MPCIVKTYSSPAMAELQLIVANSTARVLTNAEIAKQAEQMQILLYQLKEEGYEFPGRMRDIVAAACRVSGPKLARLQVIRKNLISDYMCLFDADKLPEQTAYALARMPVEFQNRLSAALPTPPTGSAAEQLLEKYNSGWRWKQEPEMWCPDGTRCKREIRFSGTTPKNPFSMCGGERCCLNCRDAQTSCFACERMCSKAKAARKAVRDENQAKAAKQAAANTKRYQTETQKNARRLLPAIEAAGLSAKKNIPWGYYSDISIETIQAWADGRFAEGRPGISRSSARRI